MMSPHKKAATHDMIEPHVPDPCPSEAWTWERKNKNRPKGYAFVGYLRIASGNLGSDSSKRRRSNDDEIRIVPKGRGYELWYRQKEFFSYNQ